MLHIQLIYRSLNFAHYQAVPPGARWFGLVRCSYCRYVAPYIRPSLATLERTRTTNEDNTQFVATSFKYMKDNHDFVTREVE